MGGSCSCLSDVLEYALGPDSSTPLIVYGFNVVVEFFEDQNLTQTIEEQIEHSKSHSSQLSHFELGVNEVVEVSNKEVFETLQSHPEWGTFFCTFDKDGVGELVMGPKFAEGGQAELYDVEIQWKNPRRNDQDLQRGRKWVLKVFKKGTPLQQLQSQWPIGMLQYHMDRREWDYRGNVPKSRYISDVCYGVLLEDGRFAFLMVKEDKDLRHVIDRLMLTTKKNHCPFSKNVEVLMYRVALGMEWLHSYDIIHRDLKASNVLCTELEGGWIFYVADFECSVGVIGTGFFRAPEILQACKDYSIYDKPELFTKKADVYSYGMVCYEILTGKLPFEEYRLNDFDHVLVGRRPELPKYVDGWMQDLLKMCWQANPSDRPSFREILEILLANSQACREVQDYLRKDEVDRAMGISNPSRRKVRLKK